MPNTDLPAGSMLGPDRECAHWFVTVGRSVRTRADPDRVVPILLADKSVSITGVKRLVAAEIRTRATVFLSPAANYLDKIKAVSSAYAVQKLRNLWLSEDRLKTADAEIDADEEAIKWIFCFDRLGRMLPVGREQRPPSFSSRHR